jgi:voltage-gated potassium channel
MLVRCTVTTVAALVAYALIPIGDLAPGGVLIRLVLVLALFVGAIVFQVRAILVAERPQLRAAEALTMAIVTLIVLFSFLYVSMSVGDSASFNQHLDRPAGIYFTTTVLSTVGFGDIAPVSTSARMVVCVQMLLDLAVIGVLVRLLFVAANKNIARRTDAARSDPPS